MTARILQRLCSDWQKRLRLMDWRITLKYEPCQDPTELGTTQFWLIEKTATIWVCPASAMRADAPPTSRDEELTLVHELLHLHTSPLLRMMSPADEPAHELALNCIAEALVVLRRGEKQ